MNWELSPTARRDMAEIWFYTADRWGIDQADQYIRQIEHDLTAAANGSPLVRPFEKVFRIKSGHHVCIFRPDGRGGIVVTRVLHERMDVPGRLN